MIDVDDLVARAADGEEAAWAALVDRFAGLVWSVVRSVGLGESDAADVSQTTWMRLAEHLRELKDTARLSAWLVTTARREAIRVSRLGVRQVPVDPWEWLEHPGDVLDGPESRVLASERDLAVQAAVALLPPRCRQMLLALAADPPSTYADISRSLGVPVGSIGPTRSRCLDRLERLLKEQTEGLLDDVGLRF
ncbi:MAG: sigma-70 family RNA polymerase sigma factor [Acidobacteriota bacterium]|nr:sigma-70 family RNA polymerase sigma factor [Acidobacteriota bacterium]